MSYHVEIYTTEAGKQPFQEWFNSLKDDEARSKILRALHKLEEGCLGVLKKLKGGISEIKIYYGPGYRIYYVLTAKNRILILWAGTKKTQQKDIRRALKYWNERKERVKYYGKD